MKVGLTALVMASAAAAAACPAAFADTETHAVNYSYSLGVNGDNYPRLTFPGFDDMGGQRTLTRVDVRVQSQISATIAIENQTAAPLTEWSLDGQHLVLAGFERGDPPQFGPFAFMGGLFIDPITAPLAASDGTPRSGPDFLATSLSTDIDSVIDMDSGFLPFFTGVGPITTVVGPFTEFFLKGATIFDPKLGTGDATVEFTDLAQNGTFSVIYEYTAVPEPTAALAVAGASLLAIGRRRR